MKKLLMLITSLSFLSTIVSAQHSSCCKTENADGMNQFSSKAAFRKAHKNPKAFTFLNAAGSMIQFAVADGKKANAYLIKSSTASTKYVLLIHEWWGLNDYIKQNADKLYNDLGGKVNVMAIDLYDGNVATVRDSAAAYMKAASTTRITSILNGAYTYAGPKSEIVSMGWCFGGGWALQSSILAGDKSKGTVMYYGMTEKDPAKLAALKGDVLGIFGTKDKWISPEMVAEFEKNLKTANKKYTIKSFDADHGFANPSNPDFNKTFTDEAYGMSLAFIKKAFGIM